MKVSKGKGPVKKEKKEVLKPVEDRYKFMFSTEFNLNLYSIYGYFQNVLYILVIFLYQIPRILKYLLMFISNASLF